jgi:hypothetical protein
MHGMHQPHHRPEASENCATLPPAFQPNGYCRSRTELLTTVRVPSAERRGRVASWPWQERGIEGMMPARQCICQEAGLFQMYHQRFVLQRHFEQIVDALGHVHFSRVVVNLPAAAQELDRSDLLPYSAERTERPRPWSSASPDDEAPL